MPSPVYIVKECVEFYYNTKLDLDLQWSIENELLKYKIVEFYQKLDKIDKTLRPRVMKCYSDKLQINLKNNENKSPVNNAKPAVKIMDVQQPKKAVETKTAKDKKSLL